MKKKTAYIIIAVLVLISITTTVLSVKFHNDAKGANRAYFDILDEYESYIGSVNESEAASYSQWLSTLNSDQSKLYSKAYDEGYENGVDAVRSDPGAYELTEAPEEKESPVLDFFDKVLNVLLFGVPIVLFVIIPVIVMLTSKKKNN